MAKITWANKTALNPQPSIARENKCTDADLNEIKTSVNDNCSFSTNEICIGEWIDNRPIYRKVLTYNSPFSQRQTLSFSSITNFNEYTKIEGLLYRSDGYTLPLPIGNVSDDWTSVLYDFNSSSFGLYIGNELLNTASKIVVIIEYTKTID